MRQSKCFNMCGSVRQTKMFPISDVPTTIFHTRSWYDMLCYFYVPSWKTAWHAPQPSSSNPLPLTICFSFLFKFLFFQVNSCMDRLQLGPGEDNVAPNFASPAVRRLPESVTAAVKSWWQVASVEMVPIWAVSYLYRGQEVRWYTCKCPRCTKTGRKRCKQQDGRVSS